MCLVTRGERAVVCVDVPAAGDDAGVPEEDDCPQLLRTRSDASFVHIQRRTKIRSARDLQRLRTHRFSINGHFYNHKVGGRERTFCTICTQCSWRWRGAAGVEGLLLPVEVMGQPLQNTHELSTAPVPAGRISLLSFLFKPFPNIQSVLK